jgi:phasin family protein
MRAALWIARDPVRAQGEQAMATKKSVEEAEPVPAKAAEAPSATVELAATKTAKIAKAADAAVVRSISTDKTEAKTMTHTEFTMTKTTEDLVSFGKDNVEAFTKAGQIWAAGVQELGKQVAATAQAHVDQTVATFKALAGVKSFKEAVDLQSTLARSTVEKAVADTGKLTDASLKLAEQTWAPLTARVTVAVEKFGRPA